MSFTSTIHWLTFGNSCSTSFLSTFRLVSIVIFHVGGIRSANSQMKSERRQGSPPPKQMPPPVA